MVRPSFAGSSRRGMSACRLLLVLLAVLFAAAPAHGQGKKVSEADKKLAVKRLAEGDAALAKGDKLMKRGDLEKGLEAYEEALAAYQAALAAFPSPKIYFPIAQAEQKLGRYVDALAHYEEVLEGGKVAPALKTQIKSSMAEVKKNLGGFEVAVEPDGAAIAIDGVAIGKAPLTEPVFLEPGQHTLTVTAEGHTPSETKIELIRGKTATRKVVLARMPVAAVDPDQGTGGAGDDDAVDEVVEGDDEVRSPPSRTGLFILVGATSTLAIAGAVTGFVALDRHGTYVDEGVEGDERDAARSSGKKLAVATDLLLVGALAVGAYTTYYYLSDYRPRRKVYDDEYAAARPTRWLSPWASLDGGGLAVGGEF